MERLIGGVILCAGRRAETQQNADAIAKLKARFMEFAVNAVEDVNGGPVFKVVKADDTSVDGGNGGGGEGSKPLVFVAGRDQVGMWNFRYLPEGPATPVGNRYPLAVFPEAGRIELCIPVTDISDAKALLSSDDDEGLKFLSLVFKYVMLIPYSIPKKHKGQIGFAHDPQKADSNAVGLAILL